MRIPILAGILAKRNTGKVDVSCAQVSEVLKHLDEEINARTGISIKAIIKLAPEKVLGRSRS